MRDVIKKMFGWLNKSNRFSHLFVGCILYIAMMVVSLCLFRFCVGNSDIVFAYCGSSLELFFSIMSLVSVFVAMCSVEFIQGKIYGYPLKWDWLDVLAGCLPALCVTACILIL